MIEPWDHGELQPTPNQLEAFAKATRTPIGFLLPSKPALDSVPIPDFRSTASLPWEPPVVFR